jgi:hypothetical protein
MEGSVALPLAVRIHLDFPVPLSLARLLSMLLKGPHLLPLFAAILLPRHLSSQTSFSIFPPSYSTSNSSLSRSYRAFPGHINQAIPRESERRLSFSLALPTWQFPLCLLEDKTWLRGRQPSTPRPNRTTT